MLTPSSPFPAMTENDEDIDQTLLEIEKSANTIQAILPAEPLVVILEDDLKVAKAYERVLEKLAKIRIVSSPKDLINILTENCVEIIISDSLIAEGQYSSELKKIKKMAPDTPIVVISSHEFSKIPEEIAVWENKPASVEWLRSMVRNEIQSTGNTLVD